MSPRVRMAYVTEQWINSLWSLVGRRKKAATEAAGLCLPSLPPLPPRTTTGRTGRRSPRLYCFPTWGTLTFPRSGSQEAGPGPGQSGVSNPVWY